MFYFYKKFNFDEKLKINALMSSFESNYKGDFYFKGEFHDFWEMVYVISGHVGVSADGTVYELSEGEVIFHKPMEFHKLWAVKGENVRAFIISFVAQGELLPKFEGLVAKLNYSQRETVNKIIDALRNNVKYEFSEAGQLDFLLRWDERGTERHVIKNHLELLLLSIAESDAEVKKRSDMRSAEIYMKIVKIMEESVLDWISVDEIAEKCSFSSSYIKKVFKKYASCGIHEYFIKMKVKKAISLLEEGYSVRQTSEKLSFGNENYFGVVFKRETGISPGKYVKRK